MASGNCFVEQSNINDSSTECSESEKADPLRSQVDKQEKLIQNLDIMKQYNDLVKDFQDNHKAIVSLNKRVDDIEKDKRDMHREIESLKNDLLDKNNKIQDLKNKMERKDEEVLELKTKNDQNNKGINNLRASVDNKCQSLKDVTTSMKETDQQREVELNDLKRGCLQKLQEEGECLEERMKDIKKDLNQQGTVVEELENLFHEKLIKQRNKRKIKIQNDSEFHMRLPSISGSLHTGEPTTRVGGYRRVETHSPFVDADKGVYKTPLNGEYTFGGWLEQKESGKISFYLCSDREGRHECLGMTDRASSEPLGVTSLRRITGGCGRSVCWECEEGESVWLEVVKMEGEAEVDVCEFHGHLIK